MMKKQILCILFALTLPLSACVTREQADEKLVRGCAAATASLLPEDQVMGPIIAHEFTESSEGPTFRHLTIHTKQDEEWLSGEAVYDCTFEETFGFLNITYNAFVYQLKLGEAVYGKVNGEIVGDAEDFIKLDKAFEKAMAQ